MGQNVNSGDGVALAYDVCGMGTPTLVFIHGWSCDRSYWAAQVGPFCREFQVVTVDLAGHGGSGLGRERWTIEAFGADVAAVVDALGLESVILIGHSMGGDVIVDAARRLPGRVQGLIWIDVYRALEDFRTAEQIRERLAPFRADFVTATRPYVRGMFRPGTDAALVERVVADMSAAPPEVAVAAMESAWSFGPGIPARLVELGLRVVAINPDDEPTDVASMERHGVEVVPMSGVGHFPMIEDPKRFNAVLREVIEGFVP